VQAEWRIAESPIVMQHSLRLNSCEIVEDMGGRAWWMLCAQVGQCRASTLHAWTWPSPHSLKRAWLRFSAPTIQTHAVFSTPRFRHMLFFPPPHDSGTCCFFHPHVFDISGRYKCCIYKYIHANIGCSVWKTVWQLRRG